MTTTQNPTATDDRPSFYRPSAGFQVTALTHYQTGEGVQDVSAKWVCETAEQADTIAALFPKSVKVSAWHTTGSYQGADGWVTVPLHTVNLRIEFRANGVNGGVNETGLRRYRSFRKVCANVGALVEFVGGFGNSIDEATLHSRLGVS